MLYIWQNPYNSSARIYLAESLLLKYENPYYSSTSIYLAESLLLKCKYIFGWILILQVHVQVYIWLNPYTSSICTSIYFVESLLLKYKFIWLNPYYSSTSIHLAESLFFKYMYKNIFGYILITQAYNVATCSNIQSCRTSLGNIQTFRTVKQ